jgi:hypothetical protein
MATDDSGWARLLVLLLLLLLVSMPSSGTEPACVTLGVGRGSSAALGGKSATGTIDSLVKHYHTQN